MTIILNEDRVIPAICEAMIGEGVYTDSWRKRALPASAHCRHSISHTLGDVLAEPAALCFGMGQETGQRALLILLSYTLIYYKQPESRIR